MSGGASINNIRAFAGLTPDSNCGVDVLQESVNNIPAFDTLTLDLIWCVADLGISWDTKILENMYIP